MRHEFNNYTAVLHIYVSYLVCALHPRLCRACILQTELLLQPWLYLGTSHIAASNTPGLVEHATYHCSLCVRTQRIFLTVEFKPLAPPHPLSSIFTKELAVH